MRHDLESGQWVEIRPLQELKQKDREVYNAPLDMEVTVDMSGDKPRMGDLDRRFSTATPRLQRQALLARLLTAWSFDLPVPAWSGGVENEASFGELPIDDFDELEELLKPYIAKIQKRPDPKDGRSPTSTASNGSSTTKAARSRPA